MKRFYFTALAFCAITVSAVAQDFHLTINKQSGIYKKGEKAIVTCHVDKTLNDSLTVRISENNHQISEQRILPNKAEFTVYEQSYDKNCAVMVEITQADGKTGGAGFVVAPEEFKSGYKEPADLMQYWNNQKALLKALPMQIQMQTLDVPEWAQGKYECKDVEINCLGPAPVRGYMAKPIGAKPKSLPIIILCRAAGVKGDWCRCQVGECVGNAALGNGALSLDINAHGYLNGQSDEYYQMLEDGMLKEYYEYNAYDRETYYFKGMYLRVLRAIEYMTQQPEWDGKRILVIGESQGGGQAAAAAGLDSRVSAVALNVPAMQDLGGTRAGRRGGWPHPIENHPNLSQEMLDATLPYFDGSLLLAHSNAEIFCEIGLIDTTCPPSAVWSSLNAAKGKKTITLVPYRTHAWPDGYWRPLWEKEYLQPRKDFISNYLK